MSATLIIDLYGVGAALLALWSMARFPGVGPRKPLGAFAVMVAAAAAMSLAKPLFALIASSGRFGPLAALLFVLLPVLTVAFFAAGCMLRALSALVR